MSISIHAPSRERLFEIICSNTGFKNFNPRSLTGATPYGQSFSKIGLHFNPRSLTGATEPFRAYALIYNISIHAPSRERLGHINSKMHISLFQSTLPHGSDFDMYWPTFAFLGISIHAPSRERRLKKLKLILL